MYNLSSGKVCDGEADKLVKILELAEIEAKVSMKELKQRPNYFMIQFQGKTKLCSENTTKKSRKKINQRKSLSKVS